LKKPFKRESDNSDARRLESLVEERTRKLNEANEKLKESLEAERRRYDEDLSQISEIIRLDYDTFKNFIFESRRIVAESVRLLEGDSLPREAVDELFRKIHTLKGNSLNFKFAQLSGMAHAVEDRLDEVRKGRAALTSDVLEALRGRITAMEEKLASIIGLAKSLTGGRDLGKVRDEGREVFIRVKLDKILALAALADDLSKTGFLDAGRLRALSTDIGRAVSGLRRCSAERLFNRFPKMVKDLAASLNKEALMETAGGDTEMDMDLLDSMGNALVHLVRNAVDHGLELPADREATGKPRLGRVFLVLIRRPGSLVFTVADDGAGIRREKIIEKAVAQGLLPASSAADLPDEKVHELLCLPGFSTAEKVTDISGRGVGMDAVVNTVRKLSGTLTFKSVPGQGSEFRIEIPENTR
jgi:chemotaxis protein histidine kinase CheA